MQNIHIIGKNIANSYLLTAFWAYR